MNKKTKLNIVLKKIIPFMFYALLIIFLVLYIQELDFAELKDIEFSWLYLAIAVILALAFRYWGAFIWIILLKSLGAKNLRKQMVALFYVYAKSWLGRYIPGAAPWILGKIYFASKLGVSKNKLAVSSLLEGGLQILVTLIIAVLILLVDDRVNSIIPNALKLFMVITLICGVIAIMPPIYNRFIAMAYKLLKKKTFPSEHRATSTTILQGSLLYIISSFLSGVAFFFVAKAVYEPLGYEDLLFVLGVSNLANAASMLAIFAPSGLGVREGIQVVLLSLIMPVEVALLIAVVTRIWSISVDFLFFGSAKLLTLSRRT